jgi:hypothetical protein
MMFRISCLSYFKIDSVVWKKASLVPKKKYVIFKGQNASCVSGGSTSTHQQYLRSRYDKSATPRAGEFVLNA